MPHKPRLVKITSNVLYIRDSNLFTEECFDHRAQCYWVLLHDINGKVIGGMCHDIKRNELRYVQLDEDNHLMQVEPLS